MFSSTVGVAHVAELATWALASSPANARSANGAESTNTMTTKAKELPSNIMRLKPYKAPSTDRIRYDSVWQRAMKRWKPGTSVKVTFDG